MPFKNKARLPQALIPCLTPCLALALTSAWAQTTPTPTPAPAAQAPAGAASAPRPRPATPAATPAPAPASANPSQRIEITGGRETDTAQRRQATASKIVIGREEIDKFGDATVGEVLRRLPGVTTPGAPGRGGPPRMRGLGGGFTQLLIDGQRVPPGFSLESLTPEQVERIEILRAPTAETGARAIAGTINIITREGFRRRLNDVRIGFGIEDGQVSPGVNWTHNDSAGDLVYNLSGSVFERRNNNSSESRTTVENSATGVLLEDRSSRSNSTDKRLGGNFSGRLQWRLGEGTGDLLALAPTIFHASGKSSSQYTLTQALRRPGRAVLYDFGNTSSETSFTNARLNAQWRQRLGPVRAELNGGGGVFRSENESLRSDFNTGGTTAARTLVDTGRTKQTNIDLKLKFSGLTGGKPEGGGEHSLVGGLDVDASRRSESRSSLQNGAPVLSDFGDDLKASSLRLAAFAQDEWTINPNWSAHAGLRWEGITTKGDSAGAAGSFRPTNRSSVWTPLLHAVWKPDPKGRDQVRMSLTRSYRSPDLGNLIARPTINRDYDPDTGSNIETAPDRAGNPELKPELATGIDIALDRYLESGGVLSANLFHRQISNLMRGATRLETVSWSPFPRYVRRMQNIGDATTTGLELEAKFRLDQLITGATPVEVRANLSVFDSKVKAVPGPDNRLDQQSKATANFGADYRLRGMPLTLGGNVNWVPETTTRIEADQTVTVSSKQVWDAYALWTFNPNVGLRLLGSNLNPRDFSTSTANDSVVAGVTERTRTRSTGPSDINWQLRLELKL
jgi:iron complex outermembrane receptor protein